MMENMLKDQQFKNEMRLICETLLMLETGRDNVDDAVRSSMIQKHIEGFNKRNENEYIRVYEIWTSLSRDVVRNVVWDLMKQHSCGHAYDMCGCWYRDRVKVLSAFDASNTAYLVIDTWKKNCE